MGYCDERTVLIEWILFIRAFLLGWCAELLQAAFLIADDIMDNAQTRRGKTAWFRIKSVLFYVLNKL